MVHEERKLKKGDTHLMSVKSKVHLGRAYMMQLQNRRLSQVALDLGSKVDLITLSRKR